MITHSKPERCEVCGGSAEKPLYRCYWEWHEYTACCCGIHPECRPCAAPIHSQADKHKRVAERISKALHWGEYTRREVEHILREEYGQ